MKTKAELEEIAQKFIFAKSPTERGEVNEAD